MNKFLGFIWLCKKCVILPINIWNHFCFLITFRNYSYQTFLFGYIFIHTWILLNELVGDVTVIGLSLSKYRHPFFDYKNKKISPAVIHGLFVIVGLSTLYLPSKCKHGFFPFFDWENKDVRLGDEVYFF